MILDNANWIYNKEIKGTKLPVFKTAFSGEGVKKAMLYITACGTYCPKINGKYISERVLAPGYTEYRRRHQFQEYDITKFLSDSTELTVDVGYGWYKSRLGWSTRGGSNPKSDIPSMIIGKIVLETENGEKEIVTDKDWLTAESHYGFCDIYDGEIYDASKEQHFENATEIFYPKDNLISDEGVPTVENERKKPINIFKTPNGETVLDFGQNMTGYVEFSVNAQKGDKVELSCAEILDPDGNFYTANYRSAKSKVIYTCKDGEQTHKPELTFFGFRYIRLDKYPCEVKPESFTAIAVHSKMQRTGNIVSSDKKLNQLFSNIIWGQKDNFLDVPTDCPQRDERLGWTGDCQVFCHTATLNFDCEKFFIKWLHDLSAAQLDSGMVPEVVPSVICANMIGQTSPGWGDVATVLPWRVYKTYGNKEVLYEQYNSMKAWVDYILARNFYEADENKYKWHNAWGHGDWLSIDSKPGESNGNTDLDLIGTCYLYLSATLVIKAGKVIGVLTEKYEEIAKRVKETFNKQFLDKMTTQTALALAIHVGVLDDEAKYGEMLNEMVKRDKQLRTGFIGTPYILHSLAKYNHFDTAYMLLLKEDYLSWLYPISKGATTMWERWDGIKEDGSIYDPGMNSYNHYAYGAVADWIYTEAAGIKNAKDSAGFEKIIVEPHPTEKLDSLKVSLKTRKGEVVSEWEKTDNGFKYTVTVPIAAEIIIDGVSHKVEKGTHTF